MGWLRDLMLDAGVPSFGALARASLAHPAWPKESKVQQRSFATMLSRFDRRMELDWLNERPAAQQALSELLRCPVGDLRAPIVRAEQEQLCPSRMRLESVPAARSLEFAEEPIPPGFPPDLSVPSSWDRLLWATIPGDGRTIAGQWLDNRGRAEVRSILDEHSLFKLPTTGPPLFIDVRLESSGEPWLWKPSRPVCLVIDRYSSNLRRWFDEGWRIAETPSIETTLDSIVIWLAQRLSSQSHFDAEAVTVWLREGPLAEGLIESFGDVLGWCGLVTQVGFEATCRRDKNQSLALVIKRAMAQLAERRDSRGSGLSRKTPDLLVAMAERSLLLPNVDWMAPRTLEAWVELLPDEERLGPDVDWMRAHLTAASKSIRARDVERAAARFPPGAHRWLGLLRDAGLLRPIDAEDFVLRPHFVARLALQIAKGSLIEASSAVWGEALFHGQGTASIWPQLRKRAELAPDALIDSALDDLDEDSPSSVLALDATVIAVGLSQLGGHEVSAAMAEQLLGEACALSLRQPDELPRPRIGLGSNFLGVDSRALWWLSLISLSENLAARKRSYDKRLVPWLQKEPPLQLSQLFDELFSQFRRLTKPYPAWVFGSFSLIERLRQAVGAVTMADSQPSLMHIPGIVLDEVQHGVLEWASLKPLVTHELLFEAFEDMAQKRGCPEPTWAESFWLAMAASDFELPARGFLQRHAQRLGPQVPVELGIAWLEGSEPVPVEALMSYLPPSVIVAWLDQRSVGSQAMPPEVMRSMPEDLAERLLADWEPRDAAILPVLWERVPERVIARIHRFRVMLPEKAAHWIDQAPVTQGQILFKAAEMDEWLKASAPVLLALRRFCCRCIDERSEGWQLGYAWLVKVEQVLSRP
jgi:hypothetical protein